jgi:hypothetical protein
VFFSTQITLIFTSITAVSNQERLLLSFYTVATLCYILLSRTITRPPTLAIPVLLQLAEIRFYVFFDNKFRASSSVAKPMLPESPGRDG